MKKFATAASVGFFALLTLPYSQKAMALDVSSETSRGSFILEEDLNIDGDFEPKVPEEDEKKVKLKKSKKEEDVKTKWVWSIEYSYTQTSSYQTGATLNSSILIVDEASDLNLSTGADKEDDFAYGLGIDYSETPEESLKDFGPNIYLSETYKLGKAKTSPAEEDEFTRTIAFKLTLQDLSYVQTFFGTVGLTQTSKSRPVIGSSTINQFAPELEATLGLLDSLTLKATYTYYMYDRDVNQFLNNLNSPRSVSTGAAGFASAISGFPSSEVEIDINWFPFDDWEFDEEATDTITETDGSHGYTFKEVALATVFTSWKFGLSYEYEQSETLNDHVYSAILKWSSD